MEPKHTVLFKLTPEEQKKAQDLELKKMACKVIFQELMTKAQEAVIDSMRASDEFWQTTCEAHSLEPTSDIFLNNKTGEVCRYIEEEEPDCDKKPCCTEGADHCEKSEALESGFDDSKQPG
jgi:hypothetical protein